MEQSYAKLDNFAVCTTTQNGVIGERTIDQLASRIRETYGIADDEAERELTDWQQRLSEINRAA